MLTITELNPKDKKRAADLLGKFLKEKNLPFSRTWLLEYLTSGHTKEIKEHVFFSIKLDKEIIGIVSIIIYNNGLAEIKDFIIEENFRNKGYGSKSLTMLIDWCKNKNIRKIYSLVPPACKEFFSKHGFGVEGYLRDHYKEQEDLVLVAKFIEREKQLNLKEKLMMLEIEKKTSEQLSKLPIGKAL